MNTASDEKQLLMNLSFWGAMPMMSGQLPPHGAFGSRSDGPK
jgi:hypothetical protein